MSGIRSYNNESLIDAAPSSKISSFGRELFEDTPVSTKSYSSGFMKNAYSILKNAAAVSLAYAAIGSAQPANAQSSDLDKILIPHYAAGVFRNADGEVSGRFGTRILVMNPNTNAECVSDIYFSGSVVNSIPFTVGPGGRQEFNINNDGDIATGQIITKCTGGKPVIIGTWNYTEREDSDNPIKRTLSVPESSLSSIFTLPVDIMNGKKTGYAIANPNDKRIVLTYMFVDEAGAPVFNAFTRTMNPYGQFAEYFNEGFNIGDFKGTVRIFASDEAGTPLRIGAVTISDELGAGLSSMPSLSTAYVQNGVKSKILDINGNPVDAVINIQGFKPVITTLPSGEVILQKQ